MKDFGSLKVWEKSHQLVLEIYKVTSSFPKEERYDLVSQIRRSASSIPANIAEGCCRSSDKDFARFCYISMGSASETKYFLKLSQDLNYITLKEHERLLSNINDIMKMLSKLILSLR